MESVNLSHKQQMLLDTVRKLVRLGANSNLDRLVARRRPVELSELFPHLNDWEARNLIGQLLEQKLEFAAHVLTEMEPSLARTCLESLPRERISQVVSALPADDAANLLRLLPVELADEIVPLLHEDVSEDVEELLAHDADSAGGIMNTEPFALNEARTVGEAIAELQKVGEELEMVNYVYITNDAEQLVGVLSLRSLLMKPAETPLRDIMISEVLNVHTSTPTTEVAKVVARYNLLAVPVVDDFNKLVGIVTVDDVIDVIQEEANEDILKLVGAPEEDLGARSTRRSVRTRAPWTLGTLLAGLLASELIHLYHPALEATILLACFIPVMVGLSGNVGNQSAALTARGVLQTQGDAQTVRRYLWRELRVGVFLGLLCGLLLTGFVALRHPLQWKVGVAVGSSALLSVLMAAGFGTVAPLLLNRLRVDPGFATGPFVSTVVDLLGIGIYFGLATTLLAYL